MTTDLEIDPRLDDLLRRTFEAVADQTPVAASSGPPVLRLAVSAEPRRSAWRRPFGVLVGSGVAAAAVAVALVAAADGGAGDHSTTLATEPTVATTELPSEGPPDGVIDRTDRVALWQGVVDDALATAGIAAGRGDEYGVWTAIPPMDPHLSTYMASAGDDGAAPNASLAFEVFGAGGHGDDPAWAQERAGAPSPGTEVPEGLLFLIPDATGTVRTAVVVGAQGLARLQIDGDPVPSTERLTAAVRRVAAAGSQLAEG